MREQRRCVMRSPHGAWTPHRARTDPRSWTWLIWLWMDVGGRGARGVGEGGERVRPTASNFCALVSARSLTQKPRTVTRVRLAQSESWGRYRALRARACVSMGRNREGGGLGEGRVRCWGYRGGLLAVCSTAVVSSHPIKTRSKTTGKKRIGSLLSPPLFRFAEISRGILLSGCLKSCEHKRTDARMAP
jgi:hypothetical protein